MQNQPRVYFITGVSGVGKSSVLKHLKEILSTNEYDIRDFDERGVPDGGGLEWHNKETLYWLEVSNQNATEGKSTIVCGFAEPVRFKTVHKKEVHVPAKLLLLHASGDTIRQRLYKRHSTPETIKEIERAAGVPLENFIANNMSYAPELRDIFEREHAPIIETDSKTSEEIAREIVSLL